MNIFNLLNYYNKIRNNYTEYIKLYKIKRLRYKLKLIKNINSVINILKQFQNSTTDIILNKLYICYLYEPPSDSELQLITILYQDYQDKLNIESYSIAILWTCIYDYINNLPKIKKQKT
jgi:hypothetical protein